MRCNRNEYCCMFHGEVVASTVQVLESTLWSRQLGSLSEQLVAALVCQIFEGAPFTHGAL